MDLTRIIPKLYVGSCPRIPKDIDRLHDEFGVTAVVNLQTDVDLAQWNIRWRTLETRYRRLGITVRSIPIEDFDAEDLRRRLPDGAAALHELLAAGHTTFVHCSVGVNRSPSVVIACLHWFFGWDLQEAINRVTTERACDPHVEAIRLASEDRGLGA